MLSLSPVMQKSADTESMAPKLTQRRAGLSCMRSRSRSLWTARGFNAHC
jgi:hypothetical protein